MSYPFFRCVSCKVPVQKSVRYDVGRMPYQLLTHCNIPVSDVFDTDEAFAFCKGQGLRYADACHPKTMPYVDGYHYNFSAAFSGYCCFCALHAGFGSDLFGSAGCYSCKRTQAVVAAFVELTKTENGEPVSWRTHGWAALPSTILDRIVCHVFGDHVPVEDGVPRPLVPCTAGQFE
jgi:hypothetical protein